MKLIRYQCSIFDTNVDTAGCVYVHLGALGTVSCATLGVLFAASFILTWLSNFIYIRTHGSGSYVGLPSDLLRWAWFWIERFKTVTKRCLYSPARI